MNNNCYNSNYTELKEQVIQGVNTWDNIFWGDDKKNAAQVYIDLADSNNRDRTVYILQKYRLQGLLAVASDNDKWFIDLALQGCEEQIKRLNSMEYRWNLNIDRINGIKPKNNTSYYDLQAIKSVSIEQYLPAGQRLNNDKSIHCCPLHNEKTPSFHYYKKQNSFACYGCGKAGDNIQFIMELNKCTFKEACALLSKFI